MSHQRPWSHQRLRTRPAARLPSPPGARVRPVRPARPAPALRAPRAPHLPRAALCAHWACEQTRPGAPARARAQRRTPPRMGKGGWLALSFSCSAARAACWARACSSAAGSAISCVARAKRGQTKVHPRSNKGQTKVKQRSNKGQTKVKRRPTHLRALKEEVALLAECSHLRPPPRRRVTTRRGRAAALSDCSCRTTLVPVFLRRNAEQAWLSQSRLR